MIKTFSDKDTQQLFAQQRPRRFVNLDKVARRKLVYLHAATTLDDLKIPPGNRLERLKGDRAHQYSMRINEQFRVCFRWQDGDAYDVEICDYH